MDGAAIGTGTTNLNGGETFVLSYKTSSSELTVTGTSTLGTDKITEGETTAPVAAADAQITFSDTTYSSFSLGSDGSIGDGILRVADGEGFTCAGGACGDDEVAVAAS